MFAFCAQFKWMKNGKEEKGKENISHFSANNVPNITKIKFTNIKWYHWHGLNFLLGIRYQIDRPCSILLLLFFVFLFHTSIFGAFHSLYWFRLQFSHENERKHSRKYKEHEIYIYLLFMRWIFMRLTIFILIFLVSIIEFECFVIAFGTVGTSILFGAIYGCCCQFTNKSSKMICIDIPYLFLQCLFRSIAILVSICMVF